MATLIYDGSYLLHRCLHVPQLALLCTKDKKPTGAVFGFVKSLRSSLYAMPEVNRVIVVLDMGKSKRRVKLYPEYKAGREYKDEVDATGYTYLQKLISQANYLKFILPKMGVKVVRIPGKEGDDIISLLCNEVKDNLVIVASDDRDMYQLITDKVQLWRPMAEERVTLHNFYEVTGIPKNAFLLRKALTGDGSDNISGVKGVGDKTVNQLVNECGDIGDPPYNKFFEYVGGLKSVRASSILENYDIVSRNLELMDTSLEEFSPEDLLKIRECISCPTEIDVTTVKRMFTSWEFFSLIEDFSRWITRFQLLS